MQFSYEGEGDELLKAEPDEEDIEPTEESRGFQELEDLFVGKVLANRYKVVRRVGIGGFGAVYEAQDTKIHKRVAVKVLSRDLVSDHAMVARFRKEAEAASKVGHENIIDITDFDRTADGYYFLVMEYLEGTDLGSVIRGGERLTLARALGILIQVCRGLNKAHEMGIIHRDLKPGNIFLTARGSLVDFVKLLDFGITKFMEVDEIGSRLTRTGQIIGTPLYMSPEQALGEEEVDARADIYSLGVIMYELVTGQPPFTAVNYLGIIAQHATDPPVPPTKVRPDLDIPREMETIILKAMAKRPDDRFATMAEVEAALVHVLAAINPAAALSYSGDSSTPSIFTTNTGISRRRLGAERPLPFWLILVIATVVGVVIALGVSFFRGGTATTAAQDAGSRGPGDGGAAAAPGPDGSHRPAGDLGASRRDAAVQPVQVKIIIKSTPSGADVVAADGQVLGQTPLKLTFDRDGESRTFTVRKAGFRSARQDIVPDEDRVLDVTLRKRSRENLPDDPKGWGER